MTRQKNDGKGRMGGRAKGTPNKITTSLREWIAQLIDDNRQQVEMDLKVLEPRDRLQVLGKLLQFVLPKQEAVSVKEEKGITIEERLRQLANGEEIGDNREEE